MIWNVLLLAVAAGLDPARMAHTAFMLTRSKPLRLLVVYLVGGFGVSMILGVVLLTVLTDFGVGQGSSFPPEIEIAVGALALVVAVLVGTGLATRLSARVQSRRGADEDSEKLPRTSKLPLRVQRALASESPWIAWVVGVSVGMPSAYYLAAIAVILGYGEAVQLQIGALFVFNIVSFAMVEIPLVGYLVAPEATRAQVELLHDWVGAHHRLVITAVAATIGAYLLVIGISKLG
jgi:Sap, sulfolipid-1-addressing protein